MGTNRSYAILPADRPRPIDSTRLSAVAGWSQWELPVLEADELAALAGAGPAVLATVVMSDFCDVAGYAGGEVRWEWSYGGVDEDGEETLPERSAATAGAIAAWAREIDHPEPDPADVLVTLRAGHLFAEERLRQLLYTLALDAPGLPDPEGAREWSLPPGGLVVGEQPAPQPKPTRAMAVDPGSRGWRHLVGDNELWGFGEPGVVVSFGGDTFLASDPPVSFDWWNEDLGYEWTAVPAEHAGDLMAAAAWARDTLAAKPGAPATADRPPRYADLGSTNADLAIRYRIAPAPTRTFAIATERAPGNDLVCDWLDQARTELLEPIIAGYVSAGGTLEPGAPFALDGCALFRTGTGRLGSAKLGTTSWRRLLNRARTGELDTVSLHAHIASGLGDGGPHERFGEFLLQAVLRPSDEVYEWSPYLAIALPEPMLRFTDAAAVLAAYQRLAAAAIDTFAPFAGYLDRGHGYWAVPPTRESPDRIGSVSWVLLLGQRHLDQLGGLDALRAAYDFASVEPVGDLWRFQATADERDFDRTRRAALHAVLEPIVAPRRP